MRRIARQTARAVSEQSDVLSTLAVAAGKQNAGVAAMARVSADQAVASEQISKAVVDMRVNAREIVTAVAQQAKTSLGVATDVGAVAARIGKVRLANVEQAEAIEGLTVALAAQRSGAPDGAGSGEPA